MGVNHYRRLIKLIVYSHGAKTAELYPLVIIFGSLFQSLICGLFFQTVAEFGRGFNTLASS